MLTRIARTILLPFVLMTATALAAGVYLNPYSLHRIILVGYDTFHQPLNAQGTVPLNGADLDFRLPSLSLSDASVTRIRSQVAEASTSQEKATLAADIVRTALADGDSGKPPGFDISAELLLKSGSSYHCICGEYATLFNEVLQAADVQSRILWLEGHVTTEYFDEENNAWVFADAHQNIAPTRASGQPLSASELIQHIEHDKPVYFVPLTTNSPPQKQDYTPDDPVKHHWLRNVLLNGECRILTGDTLQASSRWSQLLTFHSRPTFLLLQTAFDTSTAERYPPYSFRRNFCTALLFLTVFVLTQLWCRRSPKQQPDK